VPESLGPVFPTKRVERAAPRADTVEAMLTMEMSQPRDVGDGRRRGKRIAERSAPAHGSVHRLAQQLPYSHLPQGKRASRSTALRICSIPRTED